MNAPRFVQQAFPKPLRLWPGVIAVVLGWLVMLFLPLVAPSLARFSILGGVAGGIAVVLWWLFFSRASWSERLGAVVLMVVATFAVSRLAHASLQAGGGMLVFMYAVPVVALALVAGAAVGRRLATGPRRVVIGAAILLGCGALALLRIDGVDGSFTADFEWRWSPTAEEKLLARVAEAGDSAPTSSAAPPADFAAPADPAAAAARTDAEWPGFRGPHRDGVVRGVRIETDWSQSPPVELWRRPVGTGMVVLRHRRRSLLHPGAAR